MPKFKFSSKNSATVSTRSKADEETSRSKDGIKALARRLAKKVTIEDREPDEMPSHPRRQGADGYFECERPFHQVKGGENATRIDKQSVLVHNGGTATAKVLVPESMRLAFYLKALSTSTYARCGINIHLAPGERERILSKKRMAKHVNILLTNWSPMPVLIREGDPCRLLQTPKNPGTKAPPHDMPNVLTAGNKVSIINPNNLPQITIKPGVKIKYVDPRTAKLSTLFSDKLVTELPYELGHLVVISAREKIKVPPHYAVTLKDAHPNLKHTSAILFHPGAESAHTLEFLATAHGVIKPGDVLVRLKHHYLGKKVEAYEGRYQGQETPKPTARKDRQRINPRVRVIIK